MTFDHDTYRRSSLENWEESAGAWVRRQGLMRAMAAPVSHRMIEMTEPQPGERFLELAAGLGETGLLAAELLAPMGSIVISDQAEAMLDGARARAGELGLTNVEFEVLNAEWIDLPVASVDGVLCRWGYMLMADPAAALAETRRVLRPGGRVALAVWDELAANPWAALPGRELIERGLAPAPGPQAPPGPFALSTPGAVEALLADAGFGDIRVEALELERRHPDFDELWESTLDLSRGFHDAVMSRPEGEIEEIRASLERRFAAHAAPDGSLRIPGRTLVASAGS